MVPMSHTLRLSFRSALGALAAAAATCLVLAPARTAHAQGSTPARMTSSPAQPLDATARREVVGTIGSLLERHYVDADTGKRIAAHLQERLAAGAYDQLTDPYRFAEVLTTDLRAVNGDRHLVVNYNPSQPAMRVGPEGIRMMGPPPGANDRGARQPSPAMVAGARRSHFNLGRADVLPGNVGYLDVRGFSGAPEAEDAIVAALNYLQYTDAMIIDLRRNGGGSAELVNFLLSHFTGPDTLASLTVKNRSGNESFTRYTLAKVPGPRRPEVPMYVLTSGLTASAGEDFAFVSKNLGRATIVGEPTAGAGHNNAFLDSGHGFATSISFTRVMDPKTGVEWERVGVQPTVRVEQDQALETAQSLALKEIASKATDAQQRQIVEALRESIEAQMAPRAVSEQELASYAGEYEGGRRVWVKNGQLLYSPRAGAPADAMVPLGNGRFAINATRYAFDSSAGKRALKISRIGEGTLEYGKVR
jgi:hypothetical protein